MSFNFRSNCCLSPQIPQKWSRASVPAPQADQTKCLGVSQPSSLLLCSPASSSHCNTLLHLGLFPLCLQSFSKPSVSLHHAKVLKEQHLSMSIIILAGDQSQLKTWLAYHQCEPGSLSRINLDLLASTPPVRGFSTTWSLAFHLSVCLVWPHDALLLDWSLKSHLWYNVWWRSQMGRYLDIYFSLLCCCWTVNNE